MGSGHLYWAYAFYFFFFVAIFASLEKKGVKLSYMSDSLNNSFSPKSLLVWDIIFDSPISVRSPSSLFVCPCQTLVSDAWDSAIQQRFCDDNSCLFLCPLSLYYNCCLLFVKRGGTHSRKRKLLQRKPSCVHSLFFFFWETPKWAEAVVRFEFISVGLKWDTILFDGLKDLRYIKKWNTNKVIHFHRGQLSLVTRRRTDYWRKKLYGLRWNSV